MTQKFQVGDRVQVIAESRLLTKKILEIDKDGEMYRIGTSSDNRWIHIYDLAPAPALVVVPQWFDTIYRDTKRVYLEGKYDACNVDMIRMICAAEFGSSHNQLIAFTDKLSTAATEYVIKHKLDLIRAVLDGYTVEKGPLYEIVIVDDGTDRQLFFDLGDGDIIVQYESNNDGYYKQYFTKAEISAIETRYNKKYSDFAVPVEEGEG
ncbi:hypothetical protein BMT55_13845 [Listeria newyorkensis]|uniref:Phage protein n=1 Tax=Listeria newyorkensis TaxID=1497681 RepID=A0ABX4XIP8_9LIST|nr:DUF1642 domain-containing protein [Listeria newyorkensis]KGL45713.1 hypothetical protein EP58_03200 [Listeria newyorkensis]PNP88949.1 hypothetical protein BMT55_13845 [Listeria newyorkensis]SQC55355.1 Protein of uncharacterised function (DUF1642) [Listeria newyorkensis]